MLNFKKYVYGLLLLFSWSTLAGSDCNLPELEASYKQLWQLVDAFETSTALPLADSLIQEMEEMGQSDCLLYWWIKYEKGEILEICNKNEEALSLYYEVVRNAEQARKWELVAETYISIARIHEAIGRQEDCLRNLTIARQIIQKHQLNAVSSRYAIRYASYHRIYDNRDSARIYATKAVVSGKQYGVQRSELDGHLLMGIVTDNIDESIYHFEEAVKISLDRKSYFSAALQQLNITDRYLKTGNLEKADSSLNLSYAFAKNIPENYPGYYTAYSRLHNSKRILFEQLGMIDSAYFYFRKSIEAGKLSSPLINQDAISQQETAFAIEKEQDKLRFEKQRSFYMRWGLLLMGLLLIAMAAGHFNNERKKRFIAKQTDLISKKNEELNASLHKQSMLLSEVHHRVKNNLQLVMSLLTLKGRKLPDPDVQAHFDDLANKVHSIALIHEQLYKADQFDEVNLKNYLRDLTNHFQSLQNVDEPFQFQLKTAEIFLNLETVLPIGIICSELISNSLKYARRSDRGLILSLAVRKAEDKYEFLYQDNGPGYPEKTLKHKPDSMGGMLISSMVRQLKADCSTYNQEGAVFTLSFQKKPVSTV